MKTKLLAFIAAALLITGCLDKKINTETAATVESNIEGKGIAIDIRFIAGAEHNHPTFAFWLEDLEGNYIETLFVTRYLASGIYGHGSLGEGKWDSKPGEAKRPATLPYWLHKRGIKADGSTYLPTPEQPLPDAISGATPQNNFKLSTRASSSLPQKFRLLMEINQPWDWNEYWHNSRYPDDPDYKTSCQPALVYAVTIDQSSEDVAYYLNPIGHSHYAGADGSLYTDLTTITTAKNIVYKVSASIQQ
ncbi:hypothetical protein [Roseimarinus sediminis]|uniref:hypothetical protein n=1 Tax=Roseimarinus sediminis TaxID=1610899 RepID=UPI003D20352A